MARRILALLLPTLPTDRLRRVERTEAGNHEEMGDGKIGDSISISDRNRYTVPYFSVADFASVFPIGATAGSLPLLATMAAEKGRLVLAAVDAAAAAAGLAPGMPLADARALEPGLRVVDSDPAADARALAGLADWCGRYTPWTATHGADCVLLDITGCAHLFGGEAGLVRDLAGRLAALGYAGRLAVADTVAVAWAVARVGPAYVGAGAPLGEALVPPGGAEAALAELPLAGLRLDAATLAGLARLGLRRIGALAAMPRGSLARRFGPEPLRRLDQALGRVDEPLSPRRPVARFSARMVFAEPIGRTEDVEAALDHLLGRLCTALEQAERGARRVELALYRVDGGIDRQAVGTSLPSRRPRALFRLLAERLDRVDAGFGIEVAVLSAPLTEPLGPAQAVLGGSGTGADDTALADLADRLAGRLGSAAVVRPEPRQSHLPECAVTFRPALEPPAADAPAAWPDRERPLHLLKPPQPVEAVAPVPDDPPVLFRWAGATHRIVRADGPERLAPEWWQAAPGDPIDRRPRDYYRVEDAEGRRFWLYRAGLYDPATPPRWFIHGYFG